MKTRMCSLLGKGPNRSVATKIHGPSGNVVRFIAVGFNACDTIMQSLHDLTNFSASRSICGHHTLDRNRRFIAGSPGWPQCANVRIACLNADGITIK